MVRSGTSDQESAPEMATLEIHKGPDSEIQAGGLRYVACRREVGEIDGGVTLYVWSDAEPAIELIRMDLFRERPHYHAPAENQAETTIDRAGRDILEWGVEAVTRRAGELAREAGQPEVAARLDTAAIEAAAEGLTEMLSGLGEPHEVSYFQLPRSVLDGLNASEG